MSNAPPFEPVMDLDPEDRPSWPKVVGIISIVWGCLGLMCACWGVVSPFVSEQGRQQATTASIAVAAAGFLWAILLIVSGIVCVQRKYAARWLHLAYSVGSILLMVVSIVVFLQSKEQILDGVIQGIRDQQSRQGGGGGPSPESMRGMISAWMTGILVVMCIIQSIWPIFSLIWFGLVKRTADSFHRLSPPVEN